jgi:tRNA nucleotidyltransferase (CCA-adding enzyme)
VQNFNLPAYVTRVMDTLKEAGHRGFVVGGSLRDLLRGVAPHDFDMTTDALPEEMLEIFKDFRVIPTGLKHGTLTVMSEGNPVELTTHRVDGEYADARHPESVSFTRKLEGDLSRRDFTVNAMAWNPETGLVDLFEGQADLRAHVLRTVGDPDTRFSEDALRILRLFRFCAKLDFEIEKKTLAAAARTATGLSKISVERVFSEITQLLEADHAEKGLTALFAAGCEKYAFFDTVVGVNAVKGVDGLPREAALRLAWMAPQLTAAQAIALAKRYHAPNAFGAALAAYAEGARAELPQNAYEARRFTTSYWHHWRGILALCGARGADVAEAQALCAQVARDGSAVEVRRLAVNGRELQENLGVRPVRTGELLLRLQDLVWQDPTRNKRAWLTDAAREICEKERDFCE